MNVTGKVNNSKLKITVQCVHGFRIRIIKYEIL